MSKQQGSASGVQSTDAFEWEVYHNSETNIFELSKKLPEDLVASLAREVILRVASRTVAAGSAARPVSQEALLAFSTALRPTVPKVPHRSLRPNAKRVARWKISTSIFGASCATIGRYVEQRSHHIRAGHGWLRSHFCDYAVNAAHV